MECVSQIITDLAVLSVTPEGLRLDEVAPGHTAEEVQSKTGCPLLMSETVEEITW